MEIHKFHSRNQKQGESIELFFSDLKIKAKTCLFGDLTDELICDQIVCGITSDSESVDCVLSQANKKDKGFVTIYMNNRPSKMKVDTGAKCNVMSQKTFKRVTNGEQLLKQNKATNLVAYGGTKIETTGVVTLSCCFFLAFFWLY